MKKRYSYILWSASAGSDWDGFPELKNYLLSLDNVSEELSKNRKDNILVFSFDSFEELKKLVNIPKEVYKNVGSSAWNPTEIVINFKDEEIYLKDFYLE